MPRYDLDFGRMKNAGERRPEPEATVKHTTPVVDEPEDWEAACQRGEVIGNGIIWKQLDFPNFTIAVLMAGCVGGVQMWCKVGIGGDSPPLIMTEEDGTWMFTGPELLAMLQKHNYTVVGEARIESQRSRGNEQTKQTQ